MLKVRGLSQRLLCCFLLGPLLLVRIVLWKVEPYSPLPSITVPVRQVWDWDGYSMGCYRTGMRQGGTEAERDGAVNGKLAAGSPLQMRSFTIASRKNLNAWLEQSLLRRDEDVGVDVKVSCPAIWNEVDP
jgi:hypothetical protein